MSRVTLKDIAKEAGVSRQTVSKVINNQGNVNPETRERILAAMEKMGYQTHGAARSTRHTAEINQTQITIDGRYERLIFYLNLAHHLAGNLALDISLHDIAFERASDLAHELAKAYSLVLKRGFDRELARELSISLTLSLSVTSTLFGESELELDVRTVLTDARNLTLSLTRAPNSNRIFALARDLDFAISQLLKLSPGRSLATGLNISRLITLGILLLLRIEAPQSPESIAHDTLFLEDRHNLASAFSPAYLSTTVMPYLEAVTNIQHVIDEIHGRPPTAINILAVRHGSIAVDITGGIRDTVELILDTVVPWRRENYRTFKQLETAQKEVEIQQKEVEIEQAKAKLVAEAEEAIHKARLVQAQVQKQELENQKMQIEIMRLALEMVGDVKPGLSQEERLLFAMKMLDPTRLIATSPLEIIGLETNDAPGD